MKTRLLTTVTSALAFSGFVQFAHAADVIPQDTVTDWSGFYVGAQVGFGDANLSGCIECSSSSVAFADDLNLNGITGGLHAGYNLQSNDIVFGIEGDINLNDWKDRGNTVSDDEWQTGSVDVLGSIRGRLGIAAGDALFFVTGGVALSDAEWVSYRDPPPKDTAKFNDIGAVLGGGVELMAFENISIRAEGLYYIFNDKVDISDFEEGSDGESVKLKDMYVIRVGASWHFN